MRLGAFTTFTPEYTFPEACKLIKSLGYEGVQPRIVPDASAQYDPSKPFNPWGNNKGGLAETAFFADPAGTLKPAKDAGLEITSVASYTKTSEIDRAVKMVQACGKLGIRNVRVGGEAMPKDEVFDMPKFLDAARGRYKELVAEAKKAGVRPCLELHNGTPFPSASGVVAFLKGIDPKDVGVLYDPANMVREGWENIRTVLNILGPYLAEVHVKNAKWLRGEKTDRGCQLWDYEDADLEDGVVNWADVIDHLKKHGYDGWLVEEGHSAKRPTFERLKLAKELLSRLLAG